MSITKVALPFALAMSVLGGLLAVFAKTPTRPAFTTPTRHDATPAMERLLASLSQQVAPLEDAQDSEGKLFSVSEALRRGPLFVYFVKHDCPCSVDAEGLFHRLHTKWMDNVTFVAVIDAAAADAHNWKTDYEMPYPLIPDPGEKIIHSFHATNSTFSALVNTNGKIERMWPGYSKGYLLDMNKTIAKLTGKPVGVLDTAYAPLKKTSGCAF
jgi:peroxiredoxin